MKYEKLKTTKCWGASVACWIHITTTPAVQFQPWACTVSQTPFPSPVSYLSTLSTVEYMQRLKNKQTTKCFYWGILEQNAYKPSDLNAWNLTTLKIAKEVIHKTSWSSFLWRKRLQFLKTWYHWWEIMKGNNFKQISMSAFWTRSFTHKSSISNITIKNKMSFRTCEI